MNQENIYRKIMDGVVVGDRDATVAGVTEALSLAWMLYTWKCIDKEWI